MKDKTKALQIKYINLLIINKMNKIGDIYHVVVVSLALAFLFINLTFSLLGV